MNLHKSYTFKVTDQAMIEFIEQHKNKTAMILHALEKYMWDPHRKLEEENQLARESLIARGLMEEFTLLNQCLQNQKRTPLTPSDFLTMYESKRLKNFWKEILSSK